MTSELSRLDEGDEFVVKLKKSNNSFGFSVAVS